jgi:membrane protease YdiL (CAAX protease family)
MKETMNKLKEWIKKYQLSAFFVLTYLTTWLLILPYIVTGDEQIFGILVLVGIFGPAFVNIIISRIIEPVPSENTRMKKRVTFLVTWIIGTVIFTFNVKTTSEIESPVAIVFYAIVGLLPAFVLASVFSKFPGVRKSLSSLLKPKGFVRWYVFALLFAPVIKLISIPITNQLGLEVISEPDQVRGLLQLVGLITVSFLYGFVFTGGLNEETGWTGFTLPRLQSRYNPFIASIVLWFFWILWHIPMQISGFWNPELDSFIRSLIGTFFARFIFTWLYNKTKGSILPAIILHASANVSFAFLPVTHVHMILEALIAVFIIFRARMWEKLPVESPAIYKINDETT